MNPEILLALVSNGASGVKTGFFMSCLCSFRTRDTQIMFAGDGYIGRARNAVAAYMLAETEIPWLLFIDMDIVFTPEHVEMLMESQEPIVGGAYYLKNNHKQVCAIGLPDAKYPDDSVRGLTEVARIGTGFLRIHRDVFEKLKPLAEEYDDSITHKPQWNFFPMPITNRELLTEDWGFCDLARDAGYKIMLDTRIMLGHEGTAVYPIKK